MTGIGKREKENVNEYRAFLLALRLLWVEYTSQRIAKI